MIPRQGAPQGTVLSTRSDGFMEVLETKFCDQEAQGTTLEPGGMGGCGGCSRGIREKRRRKREKESTQKKKSLYGEFLLQVISKHIPLGGGYQGCVHFVKTGQVLDF